MQVLHSECLYLGAEKRREGTHYRCECLSRAYVCWPGGGVFVSGGITPYYGGDQQTKRWPFREVFHLLPSGVSEQT